MCLRRGLSASIERLLSELIARSFPLPSGCVGKGHVLGGAYGDTHYGWLYLSLLWVDEALRGQGWGTRLVELFEAEAVTRGCHGAGLLPMDSRPRVSTRGLDIESSAGWRIFLLARARLFYWKPLPKR